MSAIRESDADNAFLCREPKRLTFSLKQYFAQKVDNPGDFIMNTKKGFRSNRILIMLLIAIALMILLLVRVAWIQVINGEEYRTSAALQQTKDVAN